MSPVSRGRKTKQRRSGSGRRGGPPSASGMHAEMVRAFRPFTSAANPLDVEIFASSVLGAWWGSLPSGREDPDQLFGLGVVEYAVHRPTPEGMAMLCALKATAAASMVREAAAAGVTDLASRGFAAPAWAEEVGKVSVGDCWQLADVYGDQASLFCEFTYGAKPHALMALIDFNHLGGWIKDVWIADEPGLVLATMREQAQGEAGTTVMDLLHPAQARRLMEAGFAATDRTWQPEVADTFREFRAVALARCRALPEPVAQPADEEVSGPERDAVVAEFLASAEARGLTANSETIAYCARLIVDHGADYDNGKMLRISPVKTEIFLLDWLPRKVILDEPDREAMPAVFGAWTRWAAAQNALPEPAVLEMINVAQECADEFAEYDHTENVSPARLFLGGVELDDETEIREVLERRMFAMPNFSTHIDGEEFAPLDPGDPDERQILIEGEHPQWHALLRDPSFDGEVGGISPRLHLAMHEIVANQLWDNDPPEVWLAGKRLLAAGVDRHEALHRLGGVLMEHLRGVLTNGQPLDSDAYRRSLGALGQR